MKLTFLGTGAGEGYPGVWCRCPHCAYARKHGGKNLRTNSCAVVDECLLLDIGPACFDNAARFGLDLCDAHTLLITHPHADHLLPMHLAWRAQDDESMKLGYLAKMHFGAAHFTEIPELDVFGGSHTVEKLKAEFPTPDKQKMRLREVRSGETFEAKGYRITPVLGNHGPVGFSYSYIIEKNGRTILYALDTGSFCEESAEILKRYRYDLIVMEGTTGLNEQYGGHMCFENNLKWKRFFEDHGCCSADYQFVLSHMSPHWCPPHDWFVEIAGAEGVLVAYDGMQIEL